MGLVTRGTKPAESALLLSNFHVLCLLDGKYARDQVMCQPASYFDPKNYCQNCGSLLRWSIGNITMNSKPYGVDAAVAAINAELRSGTLNNIVGIGNIAGTAAPSVGMSISKRGATTLLTQGQITSVDARVLANVQPGQTVWLENTVGAKSANGSFTLPGDSGSIYVDTATRNAVALHFAGDGTMSFGSDIRAVTSALQLQIP